MAFVLSLCGPDFHRHDLFRPALYLSLHPHLTCLPLLQLRCQASLLSSHLHLCPSTRRYRTYSTRLGPFCPHPPSRPGGPPPTLGDELHSFFHCPTLTRTVQPYLHEFAQLLADTGQPPASLPDRSLLALMLASDPRPLLRLSRPESILWIRTLTPSAASFAAALHLALTSLPHSP